MALRELLGQLVAHRIKHETPTALRRRHVQPEAVEGGLDRGVEILFATTWGLTEANNAVEKLQATELMRLVMGGPNARISCRRSLCETAVIVGRMERAFTSDLDLSHE